VDQWLPGILDFLPRAYRSSHSSGYLYLASHVVRACGTEQSPHRVAVAAAVAPMIRDACSRLNTLDACNRCPHDADDLFLMTYKGLTQAPSLFLEESLLSELLRISATGLLVQHHDAFRSIQSFIWRLLDLQTLEAAPDRSRTIELLQVHSRGFGYPHWRASLVTQCLIHLAVLQRLLVTYGPTLIRLELGAVVGLASENKIPDIASTFLQLLLATSQAGQQWLIEAVSCIPDECATRQDKDAFIQRVQSACILNRSNHAEMEQSSWSVSDEPWACDRLIVSGSIAESPLVFG
jgi:transportin-3